MRPSEKFEAKAAHLLFLVYPEFIPESPPLTRSRGMLAYLLFCRGPGIELPLGIERVIGIGSKFSQILVAFELRIWCKIRC